jgi:Tol biopolymer transport system component
MTRFMSLLLGALVLLVILIAPVLGDVGFAAETSATTTGGGGKIVFASYRDDEGKSYTSEIYTVDVKGKKLQRLTNNNAKDANPAWSPDGQQIVFASNRDGNFEIYVMNSDGSNQHRLTNHPADDNSPTWSGDGKRIAFHSYRDGRQHQIYSMDMDGNDIRRLTNNDSSDYDPKWSPDGKYIVFVSVRDGNYEVYVMDADGSNQRRITHNSAPDNRSEDESPSWSWDSRYIMFVSFRNYRWGIYVTDLKGKTLRCVDCSYSGFGPVFSPDNKLIAMVVGIRGSGNIYLMNASGTGQRLLLDHDEKVATWSLAWQPAPHNQ